MSRTVAVSSPRWLAFSIACLSLMCGLVAEASAPSVVAAVSRKNHTGVGNFDIPLIQPNSSPIVSLNAIECRLVTGTPGLAIVFSFDQPVNAATVAVARNASGAGTSTPSVNSKTFGDTTLTVNLAGLADSQKYTVTLTNIVATDGSGTNPGPVAVTFSTMQGDVNASGLYTTSDVNVIKSNVGIPVNAGNFRSDVNCNGVISVSDVNVTKAKVGVGGFPTGTASTNTPPTIAPISPPAVTNDGPSTPIGFAVGDAESDPSALYVSGHSSDQNLLTDANIVFGGTGSSRTISVTPTPSATGTCTVTVTVTDGIAFTSTNFDLTVTDGTTLFIASLVPQAGVASTGSGTATLQLSGDQTYAILRFNYGNLSSPKVAEHIHYGPATTNSGPIIFDIDQPQAPSPTMQPLPDGSYKWVLADATLPDQTILHPADQVAALQSGNMYMNVHTMNVSNGEIRGQFKVAQGSQTFTPPPPAPALPSGPATPADASRFLQQATFGATMADINSLVNDASGQALTAFNNWIDAQVAVPQTNVLNAVKTRVATTQAFASSVPVGDPLSFNPTVVTSLYSAFINGPDQLRQRVAYAYSQVFVISDVDDNLDGHPAAIASYHDMLAADAFVNFRTLLNDVTLHPVMGQYLTMRGNTGPNSLTSTTTPNENYAREILQLFSIGLNFLQPDGTLMLDANGLPIPTYSQSTITSFAHVFTGWDARTGTSIPVLTSPATTGGAVNESYIAPMTVSASSHSVIAKGLLSYDPSNPSNYPTIPQNLSQSTASANGELATALDNVFNHPNVGPFIARRLIQRLVCDNPSPAYVYRVAQIFNNNGSGVRGDMKAVIRAILIDYEARSTTFLPIPSSSSAAQRRGVIGYGKVREPVLRMTQLARAFHPKSKVIVAPTAGVATPVPSPFRIGVTDGGSMSQTPYRAPTVFNFYEPDFADAGIIAAAGLVSPEMEIETETTTLEQHNTIYNGVFSSNPFASPLGYGLPGGDICIDLSASDPANGASPNSEYDLAAVNGSPTGTAAGTAALVDRLNLLLMANQMPIQDTVVSNSATPANNKTYTNMRTQIINYVNTLPTGTTGTTPANLTRARVALRLVVSSPQYNAQK